MTRLTFHRWTKRLAATVLAGCTAVGATADEGTVRISHTSPTGLVRITDNPAIGKRLVVRAQSDDLTPKNLDILEDYQVLPDGTIVLPPGWKFVDEAAPFPAGPGVVTQKIVTQEQFHQQVRSPSKHPTPQSPVVAAPDGASNVKRVTGTATGEVVHATNGIPADLEATEEASKPAPMPAAAEAEIKQEKGGVLFRKKPGGLVGKILQLGQPEKPAAPTMMIPPASTGAPAAFPNGTGETQQVSGEIQTISNEVPAADSAAVYGPQNLIPGATYIQMPDGSLVLDSGYGYGHGYDDYGYSRPRSEMTRIERDHYRQDKIDARRERIEECGSLADRAGKRIHRSWLNYFIPRGCGGKGCPPVGCYNITYPVNPWHNDCRDGGVYAAEGYGGPVSVPLAPVVRHTYNYGWGVPSSRLTPVSHMAPWNGQFGYAHLPGHPYHVRAAANPGGNGETATK